jgi:hypothetical protein
VSEHSRLAALHSYGLLDAVRPVVLDDLTRLASRIFDTPMSTVTLVGQDRQWFAATPAWTATRRRAASPSAPG